MKRLTIIIFLFIAFLSLETFGQIYPQDTLFNQIFTPSGNLQVSAFFSQAGFPTTYTCRGADDFICADQWTVTKVFAIGGYFNGSKFPQFFHVSFYTDNGNIPGTEIYREGNIVDTIGENGFEIKLDEPVVLEPGHYWVTVDASVATGFAEWGWKPSSTSYSHEAVWRNPGNGFGTGYTNWTPITTAFGGTEMDYSFALFGIDGIPASNPQPSNEELAVDLNADLTWNNPGNAVTINLLFGTHPDSLTAIYSGSPVTTFDQGMMEYSTDYYWRVDVNDGDGTATGVIWKFSTIQDPNIVLNENFDLHGFPPNGWDIENTGDPVWEKSYGTSAYGEGANSIRAQFFSNFPEDTIGNLITYTFFPLGKNDSLQFDHAYAPDAGGHVDTLQIYYSTDDGISWILLKELLGGDTGTLVTAPMTLLSFIPTSDQWDKMTLAVPEGTNKFLFKAKTGNGNNLYLDNIKVLKNSGVPVELSSFSAKTINNNVVITWTTETETNNRGFKIEKSQISNVNPKWNTIGFIEGRGTTTDQQFYSFKDKDVKPGEYDYRLKQIDFDGTIEYSTIINVTVNTPSEFSLEQNYPNPFNPSTSIRFSLKTDSKVTLTLFNILGQEVKTLVQNNLTAGVHKVEFNAADLNSGVYFYQINADGNNGQKFSNVKKMILSK